MAGIISITDILRLAQSVHQMCQEAHDSRGALQEAALKVSVVTDILSELPPEAVHQQAMQEVHTVLQDLHKCVFKTCNLKGFIYMRKAKDIANEIRNLTGNLQFYMNSLQISQTAAVFRKLVELDNAMDDVEDQDSLRQQLEQERQQQKELNALLRRATQQQHTLDASELQRLGCWIGAASSHDEIQELIEQMMEERDQLVANYERDQAAVKDRMEAEHLAQIIRLLEQTALEEESKMAKTTQLPPEVMDSVTCPITSEIMIDPVIVDGIHCKCCMSRKAFVEWQKVTASKSKNKDSNISSFTCHQRRGPLRSSRVSPNVGLAQVAAFVMTQQPQPPPLKDGRPPRTLQQQHIAPKSIPPRNSVPEQAGPPQDPSSANFSAPRSNPAVLLPADTARTPNTRSAAREPGLPRTPVSTTKANSSTASISSTATELPERFYYELGLQYKGHSGSGPMFCVAMGGSRVVSGRSYSIHVWDVDTGKCLQKIEAYARIPHKFSTARCCQSLQGGTEILIGSGPTLRLWSVDSGECLRMFVGHTREIICCAILAGEQKIVSGGHDKTVRVWDRATSDCIFTLKGHTNAIRCCAALNWDGQKAVTGSDDTTLRVWNVENGECLQILRGNLCSVRSCNSLDDGTSTLVSASASGTLKVWNGETGACSRTIKAHKNSMQSEIFCIGVNGGKQIVSGSRGKSIKVWDTATGELLQTVDGSISNLTCCAAIDGGKKIVCGSANGTLRVWTLLTDEKL